MGKIFGIWGKISAIVFFGVLTPYVIFSWDTLEDSSRTFYLVILGIMIVATSIHFIADYKKKHEDKKSENS